MVLDAVEDTMEQDEDVYDIPMLDRHLGKRDMEAPTRVVSKEEILQQREEMLQKEIMDSHYEDEDDQMAEENYDYSTAFFQQCLCFVFILCFQLVFINTYSVL